MTLTIFYDSQCPLCLAEMQQLKAYDNDNRIHLVSLHAEDFHLHYPHIDREKADQILHGMQDNGEMLYGLDVTCSAWTLVGKYKWLKVLRWPLVQPVADIVYLVFARYRNTISFLLTGKKRCNSCLLDNSSQTG